MLLHQRPLFPVVHSHLFAHPLIGSITSRCSGKESTLLLLPFRGGRWIGLERAAEIEPNALTDPTIRGDNLWKNYPFPVFDFLLPLFNLYICQAERN